MGVNRDTTRGSSQIVLVSDDETLSDFSVIGGGIRNTIGSPADFVGAGVIEYRRKQRPRPKQ